MKTPPPTDPNKLALFTLYAFLIGLFAAFTPEAIKEVSGASQEAEKWHPVFWWFGTLAALLVFFPAFDPAVKRWFRPRYSEKPLHLASHTRVRPARGLMVLISKGVGVHSALNAVGFHRDSLTHLWLVHSSDAGSVAGTAEVQRHAQQVAPSVHVHQRILHNIFSVELTKALVESIRREAHAAGIEDPDFICDFTGMNKPVSAGVVLACIRPGHRLQYMEPNAFLPGGEPDQQAGSHPTEVDVNYDVELIQEPENTDL